MGFWHKLVKCRGDAYSVEYHPPHELKINGYGPEGLRLIEEAAYGVTIRHCRCSTCGKRFINRTLGDDRE